MRRGIQISLKPGERIFINGAVLRVDRKVTIELLNDVTFLLENHVMQVEEAVTPLRQLYFIVQTMLIDPGTTESAKTLFASTYGLLMTTFTNPEILAGLAVVNNLIEADRPFDALKNIRVLLPLEDQVLASRKAHKSSSGEKREHKREVA
jgi:flagellar protein FlbT